MRKSVLAQALALPFPDDGMKLKEDTRLQYAGILMEANRFARPRRCTPRS